MASITAPSSLNIPKAKLGCNVRGLSRKATAAPKATSRSVVRASGAVGEVPDMGKRNVMNLLLVGAIGLPATSLVGGFAYFFVPPGCVSTLVHGAARRPRVSSRDRAIGSMISLSLSTQQRGGIGRRNSIAPRRSIARSIARLDRIADARRPHRSPPPSSINRSGGGGGGGQPAKDAQGNDVKKSAWLKTHLPGDRTLTQGLKVRAAALSRARPAAMTAARQPRS
jgi:hypothetical protein